MSSNAESQRKGGSGETKKGGEEEEGLVCGLLECKNEKVGLVGEGVKVRLGGKAERCRCKEQIDWLLVGFFRCLPVTFQRCN